MKKKELRIVFMGTPEFAISSLKKIIDDGYEVVGVITAPDKLSGRGKKITTSPVKEFALEQGLHILQPENLKDPEFIADLELLKADLQVVVAFRMLPEVVWQMPALGTFNLHASLLPQYRGAAPINHAIMNGESTTGLTSFFIDKKIDTGNIIKQVEIEIGDDESFGDLHDRMMNLGADLVSETIGIICSSDSNSTPQSALIPSIGKLHPAPKIFKADCRIDWNNSVDTIHNFVRGLSPYPAAFTYFSIPSKDDLLIKVFRTEKEEVTHDFTIGKLVTDGKQQLKVAVRNGFVHILELQTAGKKRMGIGDFLRGTTVDQDWMVK